METRIFTDQLRNKVAVPCSPKRIISLVPSQTELLADLGLNEQVVGITKFCIHPAVWRKSKTIIGGTKKFDFNRIRSLNPDLIIGNKEENYLEGIEQLKREFPVWMSDVTTFADAIHLIEQLGMITGCAQRAVNLIGQIENSFKLLEKIKPFTVLYLIWKEPWMAAGRETFINSMLEAAGFKNVLKKPRYPELTDDAIRMLNPEIILLSSEPYPFADKHKIELERLVPGAKVILVNGESFSWYGSRLLKFADYVKELRLQLP
ncbi:MAG: ABC transporter substrate-binding protein [Flammeovirgaceae bacterium]|nr:MAG: ABC transporter substrate-binding protein [Flammeovirgaceae bacterium]